MAYVATASSLHPRLRAPCGGPPVLVRLGPSERVSATLGEPRRRRRTGRLPLRGSSLVCRARSQEDAAERPSVPEDKEVRDLGVEVALSMLKFYRREISPLLPASCRFLPTCSEYSMQAYKKYGVAKGTILTAWRLCRCHPLGIEFFLFQCNAAQRPRSSHISVYFYTRNYFIWSLVQTQSIVNTSYLITSA